MEAAAAGFEVSAHQLKRLSREGLLPRPIQRHRVGKAGSTSEYPADTVGQLLGVLRLRAHGYRTFHELRVAAWLEGLSVNFALLRPEVVSLLRSAIKGQQRLDRGKEEDQLDRRLSEVSNDRSASARAFQSAIGDLPIQDVLLTVLQLAGDTTQATTASETFDDVFAFAVPELPSISDVLFDWELPGMPKWPRIISRCSRRWFAVGLGWLQLITAVLTVDSLRDLSPSPAADLMIDHIQHRLSAADPGTLEVRNMIACQGIVLASQRTAMALEIFKPN